MCENPTDEGIFLIEGSSQDCYVFLTGQKFAHWITATSRSLVTLARAVWAVVRAEAVWWAQ